MRSLHTLEDLRRELPQLDYSPGTVAEIDKALIRFGKITAERLDRVPVDLDAYDRRFGGRVDVLSLGFRSVGAYGKWRSLVRGALKRAEGHAERRRAAEVERDDWQLIIHWIESESGWARRFGLNKPLVLHVLVERARRAGLMPKQLDAAWCREQRDELSYERRKSFLRGVRFVNELIGRRPTIPATIGDLLPSHPLPVPPPIRGSRVDLDTLPTSFCEDLARFLNWYRCRGRDERLGRLSSTDDASPASVSAYRSAVCWLVRELVDAHVVAATDITTIASICRAEPILEAAIRFSERRAAKNSPLVRDSSSLHSYVAKLTHVAVKYVGVDEAEARSLRDLLKQKAVRTAQVGKIAASREAFLRKLSADRDLQRAVLLLPDKLIAEADRLRSCWDELPSIRRMTCLRLAMAGCQTALLLRTMPIRACNLRALRFRGPDATLVVPNARDRLPRIAIPAEQVKNGRHLEATVTDSSWPIVRKWIEVYRPLLVQQRWTPS